MEHVFQKSVPWFSIFFGVYLGPILPYSINLELSITFLPLWVNGCSCWTVRSMMSPFPNLYPKHAVYQVTDIIDGAEFKAAGLSDQIYTEI